MNEDKATRYHRSRRQTEVLLWVSTAALLTLLVVTPASVALRDAVASAARRATASITAGRIIGAAVYAAVLWTVLGLLAFPFRASREWALERRYGLDRATFGEWLSSHVRAAAASLPGAIGGAIAVLVCARWAGATWWVLAAIAIWMGQISVMLASAVSLRRIGAVRPIERASLVDRLQRLAGRAGVALDVRQWREGERSERGEALLVGAGRAHCVLLSDALVDTFSDEEIEAVVAHEMAHALGKDVWISAALRLLVVLAGFGLADIAIDRLGGPLRLAGPADLASLPLLVLVVGAARIGCAPLTLWLSRALERRADRRAIALTGNPAAFVSVMRRLAARNLAEDRATWASRLFFATHPLYTQRVAAGGQEPSAARPARPASRASGRVER